MEIRLSNPSDAPQILDIYAKARSFMVEQGNPSQWAEGAPNEESLQKDLAHKASYIVEDEGQIVGTFALYHNDLNYEHIDGEWLNEEPYVVLHRMASTKKGVGSFILKTICGQYPNVRIDTHKDNIPMKNLLKKMGFVYCGIIPLLDKDNSLREAYMKISIL